MPYMCSLPLVFQTTEEWLDSQLGVHPVQVALQVALPELDGAIEPIVFAGRDSNTGKSHSLPDRIDSLCARAIKWASLTKKKNAEKKLAITVFSFPPDKGNVGTAAYLNVFGSIFKVLTDLKKDGYNVGGLPASEKEPIMSILNDEEQRFNSNDLNVAYKMTVEEYQRLCPYAEALEENWGAPPGQLNTNGQELLVYGRQFGNVFIGVQPTFGYEGDPMRLLFSKSASPHHASRPTTRSWSRSSRPMPCSTSERTVPWSSCPESRWHVRGLLSGFAHWKHPEPLLLCRQQPVRGHHRQAQVYANTISYLTPPAENAGLYKGLKELKELISSYQA